MSRHRLNESSSFIYDIRLRRRASIRNDAPIGDVDEHYRSFAWIGDSDRYSDDSDATATVPLDDAMVPLAETAIAPAVAAGAYDAATIPVVHDSDAEDDEENEDGEDWFSRDLAALEAGERGAEDRFVFNASSCTYGWVEKWASGEGSVKIWSGEEGRYNSLHTTWTLSKMPVL